MWLFQKLPNGFKKTNAVSGFKKTGIWPLNADVFTDEDFAPADVTD